ncbi:TonB-dependent receptor [Methylosinus sp. Sm6]|nr:TonB-dependent receptor [Methylosinus sp. Sm6]
MLRGRPAVRRFALATTALSGFASLAVAQEPATSAQAGGQAAAAQVEEVKVTSRLREEKAQDVPLPVSVVGGKTADREHIERLQDFAQKAPSFTYFVGNPRGSGVAIRGTSGAFQSTDGAESAVGFIVDNVFFTHTGFQWADYVDLQSLEIARGPQGTLLGKNTTAGAVVIHTQLPSFARGATLETSYGNRNRFIEKLNVTGPIIDDQLAYRVTFFLDKSDGFIHDKVTGAGLLDNDRWGVRAQLLYVGDNFTDRFIFERLRSDEYNNYSAFNGDSIPFFANGAANPNQFSKLIATRLGKTALNINDPYSPYLTRLGKLDQRTHGASNEINIQIGANTLTSVTAWRNFILHPRNSLGAGTTVGNELEVSSGAFDTYANQFSQEIRLASPKDETLSWQVGLYGLRENVWSLRHDDYGSDAAQWFSNNIDTDPGLLNGVVWHGDGKMSTTSFAAFGQATWRIDEQWALTAGLRDTYEIKTGSNVAWISGANPAYNYAAVLALVKKAKGLTTFDTGFNEKANNSLSGLFNPSYRVNENFLVYSSVSRGEKSGGVNTTAQPVGTTGTYQPVIIKPEVTWDYELGAKTSWFDNKLVLNANLYWQDTYNFQTQLTDDSLRDGSGNPIVNSYLGNIGHVRFRGVEFDGRWQSPIERLAFTFSGALTEARYIDHPKGPRPVDWGYDGAPTSVNLSGTKALGVSPLTFNVGATYEHPIGAVFADAGLPDQIFAYTYVNASWKDTTPFSNPYSIYKLEQRPYTLVNLGIGLRTEDDKYNLFFWAKNLFDERYKTSMTIALSTPNYYTFGDPRWFGGTLRVKLY